MLPSPTTTIRASAIPAVLASLAALAIAAPTAAAAQRRPRGGVCEGETFSQPFLEEEDTRFYTPLPGGEFNSASEGWKLAGGAAVITAARPLGASGGVLSLPVGATAISPPLCVTLSYPAAKVWVQGADTSGQGVAVYVSYEGTSTALAPQEVSTLWVKRGQWRLRRFSVAPQLAGTEEAPREVQFIFEGRKGTSQLFGVWVDPRMGR